MGSGEGGVLWDGRQEVAEGQHADGPQCKVEVCSGVACVRWGAITITIKYTATKAPHRRRKIALWGSRAIHTQLVTPLRSDRCTKRGLHRIASLETKHTETGSHTLPDRPHLYNARPPYAFPNSVMSSRPFSRKSRGRFDPTAPQAGCTTPSSARDIHPFTISATHHLTGMPHHNSLTRGRATYWSPPAHATPFVEWADWMGSHARVPRHCHPCSSPCH